MPLSKKKTNDLVEFGLKRANEVEGNDDDWVTGFLDAIEFMHSTEDAKAVQSLAHDRSRNIADAVEEKIKQTFAELTEDLKEMGVSMEIRPVGAAVDAFGNVIPSLEEISNAPDAHQPYSLVDLNKRTRRR